MPYPGIYEQVVNLETFHEFFDSEWSTSGYHCGMIAKTFDPSIRILLLQNLREKSLGHILFGDPVYVVDYKASDDIRTKPLRQEIQDQLLIG